MWIDIVNKRSYNFLYMNMLLHILYYRPTSFTSYFTSFARKVTQSRAKIWSMGDNWNMENLIVLTPAWSSMKEPQKRSRQWRAWINKARKIKGFRDYRSRFTTNLRPNKWRHAIIKRLDWSLTVFWYNNSIALYNS